MAKGGMDIGQMARAGVNPRDLMDRARGRQGVGPNGELGRLPVPVTSTIPGGGGPSPAEVAVGGQGRGQQIAGLLQNPEFAQAMQGILGGQEAPELQAPQIRRHRPPQMPSLMTPAPPSSPLARGLFSGVL